MKLSIGDQAPDFHLYDQNDEVHSLADYEGQWVLVYFYPKDDTPGCTLEAKQMKAAWLKFAQHNTVVLGISSDPVSSHQHFANKYDLPFPLLADTQREAIEAYGAAKDPEKSEHERGIRRVSFLIDSEGTIRKIYEKVNPDEHAQEVLSDIQSLK